MHYLEHKFPYIDKYYKGSDWRLARLKQEELRLLLVGAKNENGELLFIREGDGFLRVHSAEFIEIRREEINFVNELNLKYTNGIGKEVVFIRLIDNGIEVAGIDIRPLVDRILSEKKSLMIHAEEKNGVSERYSIITDVYVRFYNKRQLIVLNRQNGKPVFLSYNQVKQSTGLYIDQIELLVGSSIRVNYYEYGDIMYNGRECNSEQSIVKDFWITLADTIENLKIKNSTFLRCFDKIVRIDIKSINGISKAIILTDKGKKIWTNSKYLSKYTTLDIEEIRILEGSLIWVIFYNVGEILRNGTKVTTADKIEKEYQIRFIYEYEKMYKNFEYTNKLQEDSTGDVFVKNKYGEYDGPSDGYGGYLDDDFINDVLDGNVDAYWGLD